MLVLRPHKNPNFAHNTRKEVVILPKQIFTRILCGTMIAGILFCGYLIFSAITRKPIFSEAQFVNEKCCYARA